ncbi:MAG TPA: DUF3558 family protein [Actinophytocola sp.]|uniref:DUF3558 family protein n=1 Tax=Actinophytocola sp. TaxID=1872138 RepID=UPI002DBABF06|nr:DUF3558 family protein [Actinophytocola sp.]HEU5470045.1 DUF3558 family protein [Actinophytocola sp.]
MSRRKSRLATLVVVLTLAVTGCGAEVDLAKTTSTRTTVPAARGIGSPSTSTAPKTNDSAFAADKLRKLDPCALLSNEVLSTVGTPDESDSADFSQCSNYMKDKDGRELNISLEIGEGLIEDPAKAGEDIGGLPGFEKELNDRTACFLTVVTETSPNRGIRIQVGGQAGAGLCDAGRTVLTAVIDRIRRDPPQARPVKGSLRELDPCGLLTEQELTPALGEGAGATATSLHWCTWTEDGADVWLWLRDGVDPVTVAEPEKTRKVEVAGISAVQELEEGDTPSCEVSWAHLKLEDTFAEVVAVSFRRYEPKPDEDTCAKAQAVAKALVPKLPRG